MALDGVRQTPVETSTHGALVAAELGDDSLLAFVHDEEAGAEPDQDGHRGHEADAEARVLHVGLVAVAATAAAAAVGTVAAALAAEETAELAIEVAPEFVKVGRSLVGTLSARAVVVVVARRRRRRGAGGIGIRGAVAGRAVAVGGRLVAATPSAVVQVEHAQKPSPRWL
ncbi:MULTISPECIES: hypothetical protein [unclassified Variovorax]|uniref:hypothetical protein n=1 Tax=unclassified Variovorax TaxID=663243 RepID=UPI001F0C7E77|nr:MULTISPECIES: hypothetical protein [unclassified Variovorax]